jgi:hypothetical protein
MHKMRKAAVVRISAAGATGATCTGACATWQIAQCLALAESSFACECKDWLATAMVTSSRQVTSAQRRAREGRSKLTFDFTLP